MLRACLAAVLLISACGIDMPWAGPSVPDAANAIEAKFVAGGFVGCGYPPVVLAANSVTDLRASALAWCRRKSICIDSSEMCWPSVSDDPGQVYVAVMTVPECTRPTQDETLLAGHNLYFIHWIGRSNRTCSAAMAQPALLLYTIARSNLPRQGTLKVELQVQDEDNGTSLYDTAVDLG